MTDQPTNQQLDLDAIEARVNAARHCPNAEANGRLDGQHTLSGSFSHIRCELCTYSRPRGERVEETAVLLAEVRRLRAVVDATRVAALLEAADIADETVSPDLPRDDRDQGHADAARDIRAWAADIKAIVESGHTAPAAHPAAVPAVETGR